MLTSASSFRVSDEGVPNGIFAGDDSDLVARLALTPRVLQDAWSVRHAAYASHGFIDAREDGLFMDPCDHFSSTRVGVVYKNGRPVGTVRVCLYAPGSDVQGADHIPAMEVFGPEIANLLAPGAGASRAPRVVEIMRLATDPSVAGQRDVALALFLAAGYVMWDFRVNAAVCAVRRHHLPIYSRLGFQQITAPRPYPKLKFETALMARVASNTEDLQRAMPMLPVSPNDDVYDDFVAGRAVKLFTAGRTPASVTRAMSTGRASLASRAPALARSARPRPRVQERMAA